jgi:hypothetical protein
VTAFRKILKGLDPLQPTNKAHRGARGASKGKYERRGPLEEATKTADGVNAVRLKRKENVLRAVAETSSNAASSTGHGCDGVSEAKGEGRHVCEPNLRKRKRDGESDEPAASIARLLISRRSHMPAPGARGSAGKRSSENIRANEAKKNRNDANGNGSRPIVVEPLAAESELKGDNARGVLDDGTVQSSPPAAGPTTQPYVDKAGGEAAPTDWLKRRRLSLHLTKDDRGVAPPAAGRGRAVLSLGRRRQGQNKSSIPTPRNEENDRAVAPQTEERGRTVSPRGGRRQG